MELKPKHICFIIAMKGEAQALIDHFNLELLPDLFPAWVPAKAFQNTYRNTTISVVINGHDERFDIDHISTQPATLAAFLVIDQLNPDLVINTGTAGGFKEKGLEIGDVVMAQGKAYFHDRRIPIDKFREYGLGSYPLIEYDDLIQKLGIKAGVISTGNAFIYTSHDQEIMGKIGATMKDMEAAAIAWVCEISQTPLIILKGITDFVGIHHSSADQFTSNFNLCIQKLTQANLRLLDELIEGGYS